MNLSQSTTVLAESVKQQPNDVDDIRLTGNKRRVRVFGHVARLPFSVPSSTDLSASCTVGAGVTPDLTWRRPRGGLCSYGIAEFAGLEFAGLENDGVEQEETYILHTMK